MRVCVLLEALGLQRNRMCITLRTQPGNLVQGINLHHMPSAVSWLYGFQVALSICCAVYAMLCYAMQCNASPSYSCTALCGLPTELQRLRMHMSAGIDKVV